MNKKIKTTDTTQSYGSRHLFCSYKDLFSYA